MFSWYNVPDLARASEYKLFFPRLDVTLTRTLISSACLSNGWYWMGSQPCWSGRGSPETEAPETSAYIAMRPCLEDRYEIEEKGGEKS
jgi:hypothetical protein